MTTKMSESDPLQRGGAREDGAKQHSYDPFCVTHDVHATPNFLPWPFFWPQGQTSAGKEPWRLRMWHPLATLLKVVEL